MLESPGALALIKPRRTSAEPALGGAHPGLFGVAAQTLFLLPGHVDL